MACVWGLPWSKSSGGPEPPWRRRTLPSVRATCSRVKLGKNMQSSVTHLAACRAGSVRVPGLGQSPRAKATSTDGSGPHCPSSAEACWVSLALGTTGHGKVPPRALRLAHHVTAIVHAGDAAEGRAQLVGGEQGCEIAGGFACGPREFGLAPQSLGGRRRDVVRARGLEPALKHTREQDRLERWQGGKGAGLECLGERMIGMVGALRRATTIPKVRDLVPRCGLARQALRQVL